MLIRVGILGLGNMRKLHFLNALRMKRVKLVAVADRSKMNRNLAERYHIKTYDDSRARSDGFFYQLFSALTCAGKATT